MKYLLLTLLLLSGCASSLVIPPKWVSIETRENVFVETDGKACYERTYANIWVDYGNFSQEELIYDERKIECPKEMIEEAREFWE